jgi:tRNA(fMet)-specific endonuclease VapC
MTRVLLDTSGYSALFRGHAEIQREIQEAEEVFINPIVLGELKAGFRRGRRRSNNERKLTDLLASPRMRVVPIDEDTSEHYAVILNSLRAAGTPIPSNDVWIASTAMQHGLPIVTTDEHYSRVPQILVARFDTAAQGPPKTGA